MFREAHLGTFRTIGILLVLSNQQIVFWCCCGDEHEPNTSRTRLSRRTSLTPISKYTVHSGRRLTTAACVRASDVCDYD